MDLGGTIRKIRQERNLSQGAFSKICGITQTYLSQIEHNLKEPNLSTLKAIAQAFAIPLPVLLFLTLDSKDVPIEKQKDFELIGESFKSVIHEFFEI